MTLCYPLYLPCIPLYKETTKCMQYSSNETSHPPSCKWLKQCQLLKGSGTHLSCNHAWWTLLHRICPFNKWVFNLVSAHEYDINYIWVVPYVVYIIMMMYCIPCVLLQDGRSALHLALRKKNEEIFSMLLTAGADMKIISNVRNLHYSNLWYRSRSIISVLTCLYC